MTTRGKLPISLGLNYSFKNRNNVDNSYGNGFVLNYYKELTTRLTGTGLKGFDGKEYLHESNEMNNQTELTIDYQNLEYIITDKYKNKIIYDRIPNNAKSYNYPKEIRYFTGSKDDEGNEIIKKTEFTLSTDNKKVSALLYKYLSPASQTRFEFKT